MEKDVFGQVHVMSALKGVNLLRLDFTADNADSRELLSRYRLPGPPSFVWLGPEGKERRSQRITGQISADIFLQHWSHAQEGN